MADPRYRLNVDFDNSIIPFLYNGTGSYTFTVPATPNFMGTRYVVFLPAVILLSSPTYYPAIAGKTRIEGAVPTTGEFRTIAAASYDTLLLKDALEFPASDAGASLTVTNFYSVGSTVSPEALTSIESDVEDLEDVVEPYIEESALEKIVSLIRKPKVIGLTKPTSVNTVPNRQSGIFLPLNNVILIGHSSASAGTYKIWCYDLSTRKITGPSSDTTNVFMNNGVSFIEFSDKTVLLGITSSTTCRYFLITDVNGASMAIALQGSETVTSGAQPIIRAIGDTIFRVCVYTTPTYDRYIRYSTDKGINWTTCFDAGSAIIFGLDYYYENSTHYLIAHSATRVYVSTDSGSNWSTYALSIGTNTIRGVIRTNDRYVILCINTSYQIVVYHANNDFSTVTEVFTPNTYDRPIMVSTSTPPWECGNLIYYKGIVIVGAADGSVFRQGVKINSIVSRDLGITWEYIGADYSINYINSMSLSACFACDLRRVHEGLFMQTMVTIDGTVNVSAICEMDPRKLVS